MKRAALIFARLTYGISIVVTAMFSVTGGAVALQERDWGYVFFAFLFAVHSIGSLLIIGWRDAK